MKRSHFIIVLTLICITACSDSSQNTKVKNPLFELTDSAKTGITFNNTVVNTPDFNIFNYRNFYNGGGVAIGDLNNDGLADVYFTANMGENQLYLNKGDWTFEEVGAKAGVQEADRWSTGAVLVDINQDGWLDIYVCNAGILKGADQKNALYLNNQDGTFTEAAAEYGLDENGYTTHAAFFDYDQDGDLDAYILNNSFMPVNTLNYSNKRELYAEDWPVRDFLKGGGDKLLKNEDGKFVDVSREAGIYGSLIGFGLGITLGDVNGDHWLDMYISNDFFERDYLYINQKDGTFKEDIKNWMEHISLASMGADMADINNDNYPEIFVTEMLPEDDFRRKTISHFESYNTYRLKQKKDFYHQYMHNTLQFNNQDASFSEIAHYSGVAASDWSWGALMFDADNDGYRDIYVCNGVYQDVTNQDFMDFFANDIIQKMALTGKKEELEKVVENMPSTPIENKFFQNAKDLTFKDQTRNWGVDIPSFSNGAAYGDLDNDGDLDLVVNNLNQEAFVFENKSQNHYLAIELKGSAENTRAIGSKVQVYVGTQILNTEHIPTRGFQSSIDYKLIFGLDSLMQVDSLHVIWHDQSVSKLYNLPIDTTLKLDYAAIQKQPLPSNTNRASSPLFTSVELDFRAHDEEDFSDFYNEGLLARSLAQEGPKMAVGDVDGNGEEDIFIGGARRQAAVLYLQKNGQLIASEQAAFEEAKDLEDTGIALFDADADGDLDLYVGSGGNFANPKEKFMNDKFYRNDGSGNFERILAAIPGNIYNTAVVLPLDFDKDGDLDLFIGTRSKPKDYGVAAPSYLLENDGTGTFKNAQMAVFEDLGMVTDATLVDVTGDKSEDLVITAEWQAPKIFDFSSGEFIVLESNLSDYKGWWYAVEASDVDKDGDQDLILGNRGENFYVSGSEDAPVRLWISDFDDNGTTEKIMTQSINGKDKPVPMKGELTAQLVKLKKQNLKHEEYAKKSIQELLGKDKTDAARLLEANYFKSVVVINEGNGQFRLQPLPSEVQFSCICDIHCTDLNQDGYQDLILAGNDEGFLPQFSKLDASFGHVLINDQSGGFNKISSTESGFFVKGDVKQLVPYRLGEVPHLVVGVNDAQAQVFAIARDKQKELE